MRPGFSLPRGFYVREDVFEADLDLLGSRWSFGCHVAELPEPGDWLTAELGHESAIVVRGEDLRLRALANVCRHRGSRVCVKPSGSSPMFACPYHAWTYRLDGSLRSAREMPAGFDPSAHGLKPLPLTEIGGLVFVAFHPDPPSLERAAPQLARALDHFGWAGAKIAARRAYTVAANWKLAMENYHECYHCGPAHPEFSLAHALARPDGREISDAPDALSGIVDIEDWGSRADRHEVFRILRSRLNPAFATGSRDGRRLAPPMGAGGARSDGLCMFAELGFLSAFLAYPDHGVIYRFVPRAPLRTDLEVIWLVDGAAQAGVDYDPEQLTWLWDVTSVADKTIIERNQEGVRSRAYEPGPFSLMEPGARQYVERYAAEFRRLARQDAFA